MDRAKSRRPDLAVHVCQHMGLQPVLVEHLAGSAATSRDELPCVTEQRRLEWGTFHVSATAVRFEPH